MSPIRPENKNRYPKNWKEIREKILARAGYRCEWEGCGVANHSIIARGTSQRGEAKLVKIILTIAHLDHQPENNDNENLRAWCQLHHNRYDAQFRAANRKARKYENQKA